MYKVCLVPKTPAYTTSGIGVVNAVSYQPFREPQGYSNRNILLGPVPGLKASVSSSLLIAQHWCDILQQHALCVQYRS